MIPALLRRLAGLLKQGLKYKDGYLHVLDRDGYWLPLPPPGRMSIHPKSDVDRAWDELAVMLLEECGKSWREDLVVGRFD